MRQVKRRWVVETDGPDGVLNVDGHEDQPVPRVGDTVVGPDGMGEFRVTEIIWDYRGGFFPTPRSVTAVCKRPEVS